jgi:hypothetical protein
MTEKYSASLPPRQPEHLLTQPITTDGMPQERTTHPDTHIIPKRQDVPRYQWNVLRSSGQLDEGWIDTEIIDENDVALVRMTKPVHRSNIDKLEKCVPLAVLQEQNIDFTNAYLQKAYGVMIKDGRLQPVADTTHATTSSQEQQTEVLLAQDEKYDRTGTDGEGNRQSVAGLAKAARLDTVVDNSPLVERVLGHVE